MPVAVDINLDYHLHPVDTCYTAWKVLQQCFAEAGFRLQEQLFVTDQAWQWGSLLADTALHEARQRLQQCGLDLDQLVSSTTVFEYQAIRSREAAPQTDGIEVSFLETGAFQAWQLLAHGAAA